MGARSFTFLVVRSHGYYDFDPSGLERISVGLPHVRLANSNGPHPHVHRTATSMNRAALDVDFRKGGRNAPLDRGSYARRNAEQ